MGVADAGRIAFSPSVEVDEEVVEVEGDFVVRAMLETEEELGEFESVEEATEELVEEACMFEEVDVLAEACVVVAAEPDVEAKQ